MSRLELHFHVLKYTFISLVKNTHLKMVSVRSDTIKMFEQVKLIVKFDRHQAF